ncbi:MAG: type VI secretion system protein TssA [Desulfobacteraceae bacterium]|jgi:type VI secretion system protein VasJ
MDIATLGKDPVKPDQPVGSDVRYEPEFEQLQAEVDKISIPSASGGINWKTVSDLSAEILSQKSKDLLVACYLAVSQIHIRQLEGFGDGLTVLHDVINTYWDTLFPPKKRMRGRIGAIEWWIEKTETALKTFKPDPVEKEMLDSIQNTLSQIDSMLQEYLPEPPLLRPIQRELEQIPVLESSKQEPEPVPDPGTEAVQAEPQKSLPETQKEVPPAAAPSKTETTAINTEQDARKLVSESMQKIRQAAAFLLENNPADPLAYRYRRLTAWSQVMALPPASDGKTQIPPPAPQVRQTLTDLMEKEQWQAFIINAEQKLSQFIFWVDLSRWVAEALLRLGGDYQASYETVCQETASFISRLPGLQDLSFSDDTPFADTETRQWLEEISPDKDAGIIDAVSKKTAESGSGPDMMADIQGKAKTLTKGKKWMQAVEAFQEELKNCASQKEALIWRTALCRTLIKSKRADVAVPHLNLILNDIDTYGLECWEPSLALEGLKLVWTGFAGRKDTDSSQILSRIARLDPVEALKLEKK